MRASSASVWIVGLWFAACGGRQAPQPSTTTAAGSAQLSEAALPPTSAPEGSSFSSSRPRKGAFGASVLTAPLPEPSAPEPAAEPAPPPYAAGYTEPTPGCLAGSVYPQKGGETSLPDEYGGAQPIAEVWGCEWDFENTPLAKAIPGARGGAAYAVRYQGTFAAPSSGIFEFGLRASGALRISIDGALVTGVQLGGSSSRAVYLGSGKHQVLIEFVAADAQLSLRIDVKAPGAQAPSNFSTRKGSPFSTPQGLAYTGAAAADDFRELVHVGSEQLDLSGQIFFEKDSAELNRESQSEETLLAVARTLKDQARTPCIQVQGHTDAKGNSDSNLRLSKERAFAVRRWLVDAGIPPHTLAARGFGGSKPLADNESDSGRAKNRRVQFVLLQPDEQGACPGAGGDGARGVRPRQAEPELARQACERRDATTADIRRQLASWIDSHRGCQADADCAQAVPLECPGRRKALACSWVLVNQSSVEPLRVQGARLDAARGLCDGLPDDDLVRSCGGCGPRQRMCRENLCQYAD